VDTFRTIQISLGESYRHLTNPESSHEIAEIVTEMYELLADMGYYDRSVIGRPPHTMGINRTLAIELGYSPEAIETMELLPYLNFPAEEFPLTWMEGEGSEFILEGAFTDLRSDEALKMCRDPMGVFMHEDSSRVFNEDEEPYMHSEYICFSSLGVNGMGAILVLDVKNCRFRRTLMIPAHLTNMPAVKLWTVDNEFGNVDPALKDLPPNNDLNWMSLDQYPSRSAREALRDYIQRFRTLQWLPGGYHNGSWEGDKYGRLYRENGWPDNFNRSGLMVSRKQWEDDESERRNAELPLDRISHLEWDLKSTMEAVEKTNKEIGDVDAGKEIPDDQPDRPIDREKYREEKLHRVNELVKKLPRIQDDLEAARIEAVLLDPKVKKARLDRIAKYGY
jgi:hypothetical protein